jgi:hypothetical protein
VEAGAALPAAMDELDAFRTLQISEESALSRRLERLREAVSFVMRREREAQDLYKSRDRTRPSTKLIKLIFSALIQILSLSLTPHNK